MQNVPTRFLAYFRFEDLERAGGRAHLQAFFVLLILKLLQKAHVFLRAVHTISPANPSLLI